MTNFLINHGKTISNLSLISLNLVTLVLGHKTGVFSFLTFFTLFIDSITLALFMIDDYYSPF